ncbi:MAG: O-antigen ligase domain-containing protein [Proteobacteria bacterium]|nr:O-antigen ligase domain-containing protein [Pseudomonadota bacterium]
MLSVARICNWCNSFPLTHLAVLAIFVLLGINRNLPNELFYYKGVGLPEGMVLVAFLSMLFKRASRQEILKEAWVLRSFIIAGLTFALLGFVSLLVNTQRYGVDARDYLEVFRYACYLGITVFSAVMTRRYGLSPLIAFAVGILITGVVAWLNPSIPNIEGIDIRMIYNPNVIGNVLAIAMVIGSIIILRGEEAIGMALACFAAVISFYTFSKGTWLMVALAIGACFIALLAGREKGTRFSRSLGWGFFALLIVLSFVFNQIITSVVEAKIAATQFGSTAAEGGSVAARWGLLVSAYNMFLMDPFFGVGLSNFETVNEMIRPQLGALFYQDDNPNNVWLYILGCMGLPAFLSFLWIFLYCALHFLRAPIKHRVLQVVYAVLAALILFIGSSFMLQVLTGVYFWSLLGFLVGSFLPRPSSYPLCLEKL